MRFPYQMTQAVRPAIALGGRWVRPQPLIHVSLVGSATTRPVLGILDTAADDTVFPDYVAARIGLDLSGAPTGSSSGVGRVPVQLRYAQVKLRVASGGEFREWPALVGFTSLPVRYPMLGFAGFLQFFTSTFHGDREEVELVVNSLYPGT
jgi:hypothetical protein